MLEQVECTGFKSFDGFELEFSRGLNVLVGPNGSGKTNLILLLEFLGTLCHSPLIEAIGRSGGAGTIFRRKQDELPSDLIKFKVQGTRVARDYRDRQDDIVTYSYSAQIFFSIAESSIYFRNQRLSLLLAPLDHSKKGGKIDLEYDDIEGIKFHHFDSAIAHRRALPDGKGKDIQGIVAYFKEHFSEACKEQSLCSLLDPYVRNSDVVLHDLSSARALNIAPNLVRSAEDIATPPVITREGSGLAATLHALKTAINSTSVPYFYHVNQRFFRDAPAITAEITEHLKLVNDGIVEYSVDVEPIESKIRIFLHIRYNDSVLKLPFALASDGTAKWFTLVTAIATNRSFFAIEEPENFLHPAMQREIVRIVRDQFETRQNEFALISTHSETILNSARPDEIIIFEMVNGRTEARRPRNGEEVVRQISKTGFGLGYYYVSGALE